MLVNLPVAELAGLAAALVAAGVITGILAGLFGVGGGAVMVPILYDLFGLIDVPLEVRMHLCIGTSLAVIIPTSIRSLRGHLAKGAVDKELLKRWSVPVVAGVIVGSFVAAGSSTRLLQGVFAVVATLNAIKLLFGRDSWRVADDMPGPIGTSLYGLVIGVFSALMGIGGGVFGNLIMTLHNRPIHQAVATSSGLGVLISIPGAIGYTIGGWPKLDLLPPLSIGYVSVIGALLIIPTSVLMAPVGVRIAHSFSKRRLEVAFGLFLVYVAARFVLALIGVA